MIVYFSGTGNTRLCALELGRLLGDALHELSAEELLNPGRTVLAPDNGRVVWMFPVYSWDIPQRVAQVMRKCAVTGSAVHWMVMTCGDDIGHTHRYWRRIMEQRGFRGRTAFSVQMPNVYTFMKGFDVDSPALEARKLSAAPARLRHIAEIIGSGADAPDEVVPGSFAWFKSGVIRPWFERTQMSPRHFTVDKSLCTRCGKCVRECPLHNISPDDSRAPKWGSECMLCERCYHRCPVHAIDYRGTSGSKGQYRCPSGLIS